MSSDAVSVWLGHRVFGQVAMLPDRPFVVGLERDGGQEPGDGRRRWGKMPTTVERRLISPLTRSSGFVDHSLRHRTGTADEWPRQVHMQASSCPRARHGQQPPVWGNLAE